MSVKLTQHPKLKGKWIITGTCEWAKVFTPDTNFDKNGVYSIDILVTEEEAEDLKEKLMPIAEEHYKELCKDKPVLKKQGSVVDFIREKYDEEGEVIGLSVQLKQRAKVYSEKQGKMLEFNVSVLDGQGNKMDGSQLIGNGSTVSCIFEPAPYFAANDKKVGVTLRGLSHVKVLELEEYGGGGDPFADAGIESDFSATNSGKQEQAEEDGDIPFDTSDDDSDYD